MQDNSGTGKKRKRQQTSDGNTASSSPKSPRKERKLDEKGRNLPRRVSKNPTFLEEHRERYLHAADEGSSRGRKKKFIYGNYDSYYSYRNPGASEDPRLKTLDKRWFQGKRVLDIGCNSGAITIEIAATFSPRHIMGVDIDPSLVQKARVNLKWSAVKRSEESSKIENDDDQHRPETESANVKQENTAADQSKQPNQIFRPLSVQSHKGSDVRANRGPVTNNLPDSDTHPFEFPYNCSFRKEDYTEDDDYDCIYDTIICLSVTKWIHFNHGDGGIKRLFDKVYKSLAPGGCFVLEIQEWSSYKKKKSLTESFKKNVAAITLRPEHFQEYLVKNVGFASVKTLRVPAGASEGFHRPLLAFFK